VKLRFLLFFPPFLRICLYESKIQQFERKKKKMKRKNKKNLFGAIGMLIAFLLWSAAIQAVDVQAIGPNESSVGFATVNQLLRQQIGVHMLLYRITDWLSLVPLGFAAGFGILGSIQWMRRKSLRSVDIDILVLGAFYVAVLICYCFFEIFVINFRPVLMDGVLEPSYPSSARTARAKRRFCARSRRCRARRAGRS